MRAAKVMARAIAVLGLGTVRTIVTLVLGRFKETVEPLVLSIHELKCLRLRGSC